MEPSWHQNRSKLGCWFERCFLMYVGPFFIDLLTQHGMAEVAKIVDSSTFFIVFWFFVDVLLGWFVDRFLIDFWSILGSKIDQKSTRHRSKKRSKIWCDFGSILDGSWIDFWLILGPSWGPSWGQVGTKIRKMKVPKWCRKSDCSKAIRGILKSCK